MNTTARIFKVSILRQKGHRRRSRHLEAALGGFQVAQMISFGVR
jgi:hypothetical protein